MCAGVRAGTASDEFVETLHVLLSPPTSARPTLGLGREVWMIFGACRKLPDFQRHAWFFGPEFEPKPARRRREQQAKSVCADCRVRPACAEYALTNREDFGIWGGLTEDERRRSVRTIAV